MPYSYSKFKKEVANHITRMVSRNSKILDVGAGSGVYCDLLREDFDFIDALEIFPEYIKMFNLIGKYNNVIEGNILDFDFSGYDYLILGDILEHLSAEDAVGLIKKIESKSKLCMVAVPYLYEQGTEFGNVYETHLQPDLTPQVMSERYPSLNLLYGDEQYGYYVNYSTHD